MLSVPPWPVENLGKVCENSRAGENLRLRLVFSLICFPKRLPRFSPGYEGMENMFYFLIVSSSVAVTTIASSTLIVTATDSAIVVLIWEVIEILRDIIMLMKIFKQ